MTNTIHMLMEKVRAFRKSGLSFEQALKQVCLFDKELMSTIGREFGKLGGRATAVANLKRKISHELKWEKRNQEPCILAGNSCKCCSIVDCGQRTEKSDI